MAIGKKRLIAGLIGAGFALSAPSALAQAQQDVRFYIGGSLGQAQVDLDCTGTTSCDDKDTSWKMFGGYQINQNFAVELGYSNLGEVRADTPSFVFGGLTVPPATTRIETTAWELVGVGSLPMADRFSLFGKLGLYRAETKIDIAFEGAGSVTDDDNNVGLTLGVGARYDFTRNLGIRAEWQRYSEVAAADFGESDVDVISIGVLWRF